MADLEERVATLERDVTALKARVGANEDDVKNIPDLIKLEFRLTNSQIARLSHDVTELQRGMSEMQGKVEALPSVVPELVVEALAERGSRG